MADGSSPDVIGCGTLGLACGGSGLSVWWVPSQVMALTAPASLEDLLGGVGAWMVDSVAVRAAIRSSWLSWFCSSGDRSVMVTGLVMGSTRDHAAPGCCMAAGYNRQSLWTPTDMVWRGPEQRL